MSRRAVDWALIVVLVGSWAVLFGHAIDQGVRNGRGHFSLFVSTGSAGGYPEVLSSRDGVELWWGDRLVSVDGEDLRGRSALYFFDRATRVARERGSVALVVERGNARFGHVLQLHANPLWWVWVPNTILFLSIGVFLLVRAPGWPLARQNLFMLWALASAYAAMDWLGPPRATAIEAGLSVLLLSAAATLAVWIAQGFTASARPVPARLRALAVLVGIMVCAKYLLQAFLPHVRALESAALLGAAGLAVVAIVAGYARSYRRSDSRERRQIRWVIFGHYVAVVGMFLAMLLNTYVAAQTPATILLLVSGVAIPAGMLVSVTAYRWLDIDRLLGAAASYTIAGILVLGAAIAFVPRLSGTAALLLGIDPAAAQWTVTMALVVAAIPVHLTLQSLLRRRMFRERHERMSGLQRLLDEVRACSDPRELWDLVSTRLDALLGPESIVVYAREGDAFTARFARGREAPLSYAADSVLARAVERRGWPLAADSSELDSFDRAALEALSVELVVPIGTREGLLAFACLGRKRSHDIYTREETAQLAAITASCAEILRPAVSAPPPTPHVFRREGDLWTLAINGKEARLRDMRGLHYLAVLLREPGREFPATDLVNAATGVAVVRKAHDPELRVSHGLGDTGPVLDDRARTAYRERLADLERELADAERCADLGRIERAAAEREALLAELESDGRGRRAGSDSERARVAVTKAIKVALERIAERHPELGAHLSATVRRGYVCAYEPDPRVPIDWEV